MSGESKTNLVEIAGTDELGNKAMKEFLVRGHEILLARVGNNYYVTDNRCPHLGGRLSRGKLEGHIVTCPRHGSQFDLRTGEVVRWLKGAGLVSAVGKVLKPPRRLATYVVKIAGGKIMIEI